MHQVAQWWHKQRRDPRYVFTLAGGLIVFAIVSLFVHNGILFHTFETSLFRFFNNWSPSWRYFFFAITQLGTLSGLIIWIILAWNFINRRGALTVLVAGLFAWLLAKVAKVAAHRGRPGALLPHVHLYNYLEKLSGYGYPSGHATLSAACATVIYYQVAPRYRKYLLLLVFLIGVSRIYLGAHLPLDVIGGWALGVIIGSGIMLIVGLSNKGPSAIKLKRFLNSQGWQISSLRFARIDARGSRPFFAVTENGDQYFGKIFGKQEHAADWLFKIFRFFRYTHLQAEEPYISSRRNVEIEAFTGLWAAMAGVRVPETIDIINYGNYWISLQPKLDATQLLHAKKPPVKALEDTWRQVTKLHKARIAHRDLRASNIMLDKQGRAYLIDFGFAEISAALKRIYMDNAELLMSMSLVVGVPKTLAAAKKQLGKEELKQALPYLKKSVFSNATTKMLRAHKQLLPELRSAIQALK